MGLNKPNRKGFHIFCVLLLLCVALAIFSSSSTDLLASDNIAVLDIAGTIMDNDGSTYDQQYLLDSVGEIMDDRHNRGLILRIDSPGGVVYQIDELYLKLEEYKEYTGRPIYAAIESYAASGGYYEACAADEIYANRNAITGSIGVIMGEFLDLSDLLDKLGIDVSYITSGSNKSMGSSYQPLTEEQKEIYQSICNEYYDRFVNIVADSRQLDETVVRKLADGRIYSAKQALENDLIDGIEPFADTLNRMTSDLGYDMLDVQYYNYQAPSSIFGYLSSNSVVQQFLGVSKNRNEASTTQGQFPVMMYHQF